MTPSTAYRSDRNRRGSERGPHRAAAPWRPARFWAALLGLAALTAVAVGVVFGVGPAVAQGTGQGDATDVLGGDYRGVDEADGWSLTLNPRGDGGFDGLLVDRGGASYVFDALGDARVAEARVDVLGQPLYMRFSPRPVGLVSFWIPIGADGALDIAEARPYAFLREGVSLPEVPRGLTTPPDTLGEYMEPLAFLRSYEFWQPQEVGRGYNNLSERYRALIRLYAHVHTDVLWKLCQSRATPPGLAEALQGQNIACPQVLEQVADSQRTGSFVQYKSDLDGQKQMLMDAVRCTRGGLMQEQCVTVSKFTSQAAISLETAATVLSRY